ncbi:MAG: transposase family protein [Oscillospiraceae bacterium]
MSAFYSDPAGRYYRLLWQEQETAYLIDCTGKKAPIQVSKEVLNTLVPSSSPLLFQDENFLSARQKRIRDERFAQLKDLVQEIPALLQPAERKKRLMECAEQAGVSVRTLAGRLFQYWVYQTPNILAPKPTKRSDDSSASISEEEKYMRRALNRFYYSTDKHSLPTAYQLMLREFYCDEQGCLLDHYPSFYQFRYFFRKHRYASNELISREGIRAYQKNGRATTGSVRDGVTGPGIYQMDATLCDIFLVSQFSETQVVGRPILYMAIDVMTQLIVGVSVGFEGGYGGLSDCLYHTLSDKVADCRELDIEIEEDQWPAHHLPKEIITDRGREFTGTNLENFCCVHGISVTILEAYRPDQKPLVEKFIDLLQNAYKPFLLDCGVIRKNFQERGAPDYRAQSKLNIRQFTQIVLRCVLFLNTQHVIERYQRTGEMIAGEVQPIANKLWNWFMSRPEFDLNVVEQQELRFSLLPTAQATLTARGLKFQDAYYYHPSYTSRFVQAKATGVERVKIAYLPNTLSVIYLIEEDSYIPFQLATPYQRYESMTLEEMAVLRKIEKADLKRLKEQELQGKLDLISSVKAVVGQVRPAADAKLKEIGSARSNERQKIQEAQGMTILEKLQQAQEERL